MIHMQDLELKWEIRTAAGHGPVRSGDSVSLKTLKLITIFAPAIIAGALRIAAASDIYRARSHDNRKPHNIF